MRTIQRIRENEKVVKSFGIPGIKGWGCVFDQSAKIEKEKNMTLVPPIKQQGIKTKLAEWIRESGAGQRHRRWVEPFMGTGVVAFNVRPRAALLCDSNPHVIRFYKGIQNGEITAEGTRSYLIDEGKKLLRTEGRHYYLVRDRFNETGNSLDFLFLSRSCFNGLMRFNRNGEFNVPFCRKPNRFAKSLITKICNQISAVSTVIERGNYEFKHQEFHETLSETRKSDLIYCDPPYIGRHVDYFDSWSESEEFELHATLMRKKAPFIMSTWLKNRYRVNDYVFSLWRDCSILTRKHFYHVGARESNRNAVFEALLLNFDADGALPVHKLKMGDMEFSDGGGVAPGDHQFPMTV